MLYTYGKHHSINRKSKNGTYGLPQILSVTHISTHKLQIDNLWYALIGSKNFLEIEGMKCERGKEKRNNNW